MVMARDVGAEAALMILLAVSALLCSGLDRGGYAHHVHAIDILECEDVAHTHYCMVGTDCNSSVCSAARFVADPAESDPWSRWLDDYCECFHCYVQASASNKPTKQRCPLRGFVGSRARAWRVLSTDTNCIVCLQTAG
jgi:hypothetical protein